MFQFDFTPNFAAASISAPMTVGEVTRHIKTLLEIDPILENVSVEGEVSNASGSANGHLYFTLKDADASIRCVMWSSTAYRYRKILENGKKLIATGKISVYAPGGNYQLIANKIEDVGAGKSFEEFLRLKSQLEAEGLFDESRKCSLPEYPKTIGVVTSATGAAIQDICTTIERRWPIAKVILSPAAVQGADAPRELVAAFNRLVALKPDVILIGRGGGSAEDLAAFNDETLVRTIASATIPVVSGVGHETDFSLTDFVADFRAPTPTGAAMAATPDRDDLIQTFDDLSARLERITANRLQASKELLTILTLRLNRASPETVIRQQHTDLENLRRRLNSAITYRINAEKTRLSGLTAQLRSLNPEAVLERGYAIVKSADEQPITTAAALKPDQFVKLYFKDGVRGATITEER